MEVLEGIITKGIFQNKIPEKIVGEAFLRSKGKKISYYYNGKKDSMAEVRIKVNDEIYIRDKKRLIKGKVLEIYKYISGNEDADPQVVYLAKIDLGITKFTLHISPETVAYGYK